MGDTIRAYRLSPYGDNMYPSGTLAVTLRAERSNDDRAQYAAAIVWREAPYATPRVVFDEIISSGVGMTPDLDEMAASALGFATYIEPGYECEPVEAWRAWVEQYGEDVESLALTGDGERESLAHLRVPVD